MDRRMRERRRRVQREQGLKRLRVLAVVGALVSIAMAALFVLHSPLLSVKNLTVRGNVHETVGQLEAAAGIRVGSTPMVDVDPAEAAHRMEAIAWVATARVARHWPWSVEVSIAEPTPVAAVSGPHGATELVDASGRILGDAAGYLPARPLLAGVATARGPGRKLPGSLAPALAVAASLPASLAPEIAQVVPLAAGRVDLVTTSGATVVLGLPVDLSKKWVSLATLMANGDLKGVKRVDLTVADMPVTSG
jgi:cell division septal protein FtsQ